MRAYQFNRVQPHFSHTGGGIWASLGSVFLHCSAFAPLRLTLHIVTQGGWRTGGPRGERPEMVVVARWARATHPERRWTA